MPSRHVPSAAAQSATSRSTLASSSKGAHAQRSRGFASARVAVEDEGALSGQGSTVVSRRLAVDAVLGLGERAGRGVTAALLLAAVLHGAMAARTALIPIELLRWTERMAAGVRQNLVGEITLDVTKVAEEPPKEVPPPVEEPPSKVEAVAPKVVNPPPALPPPRETPPAAPAAAQAGQVLAQEPDPNEPIDLTNTFVQGNGAYAGGVTAAAGTSTTAVTNTNARPDGVAGGTGRAAAAPSVDRSRKAASDQRQWDSCGFPSEADIAQIEEAVVQVEISIGADGAASKVDVLRDPGNGFGKHAKRCGIGIRFTPALDRDGRPTPTVQRFNVTFTRQ